MLMQIFIFLKPASITLSNFCSVIPLIFNKFFLGLNKIDSIVWNPESVNFFISALLIPDSSSFWIGVGPSNFLKKNFYK